MAATASPDYAAFELEETTAVKERQAEKKELLNTGLLGLAAVFLLFYAIGISLVSVLIEPSTCSILPFDNSNTSVSTMDFNETLLKSDNLTAFSASTSPFETTDLGILSTESSTTTAELTTTIPLCEEGYGYNALAGGCAKLVQEHHLKTRCKDGYGKMAIGKIGHPQDLSFEYTNRCYKHLGYENSTASWSDAEGHCKEDGTIMAAVHWQKDDDDFVYVLVKWADDVYHHENGEYVKNNATYKEYVVKHSAGKLEAYKAVPSTDAVRVSEFMCAHGPARLASDAENDAALYERYYYFTKFHINTESEMSINEWFKIFQSLDS